MCCVGCENSNPKSTERATSIPSVVLKSNGRAGYTMGDSNTVSLVVPVSFRDSDAVVFVTLERSGLRPDTSFTVPMPPNGEDVRENTFFLPLSVERCYIQTWCSWHHDPNLEAYVSLADNRNHIQLGDLLKLNSADTLERLVQRGSITQTMAALRLLELVTNDTLLDEALVGRLQQSIQTVHHAYERDVLSYTSSLLSKNPDFDKLEELLLNPSSGYDPLSNGYYNSVLLSVFRYPAMAKHRKRLFQFVTTLFGNRPKSIFSQWHAYLFKRGFSTANLSTVISLAEGYEKNFYAMNVIARLASREVASLPLDRIQACTELVQGITDSLLAIKQKHSCPPNKFIGQQWDARQLLAMSEVSVLAARYSDTTFLHPVKNILPTLQHGSVLASGLALSAAGRLRERNLHNESYPFYALPYRFVPFEERSKEVLDSAFPPRIQQRLLDSLLIILEQQGYISPNNETDLPPALVAARLHPTASSIVLFVSSTCSACGAEIAMLKRLQNAGMKFNILVVFVGTWTEGQKDKYETDKALTCLENVPPDFVDRLLVSAVPTSLILTPTARMYMRFDGMPGEAPLKKSLEAAAASTQ